MKLKICGIQDSTMWEYCHKPKIDYIGINFVKTSKRKVKDEFCNFVAKKKIPTKVGIFKDHSVSEVVQISRGWSLGVVQLHGEESVKFIDQLKHSVPHDVQIWKALTADKTSLTELQEYSKNCDLVLFDGEKPGSGSQISNYQKLEALIKECENINLKYGIAGGINPQNIHSFKMRFPRASLLDTASGVESNGKFDSDQLEQLVYNFRHDN